MFHKCYKSIHLISIIGCLLFYPCFRVSTFLGTSFIAVPIIVLSTLVLPRCHKAVKHALKFCGQYSLEIYLANVIVYTIFNVYTLHPIYKLLLYIIVEIVMTLVFIAISNKLRYAKQ